MSERTDAPDLSNHPSREYVHLPGVPGLHLAGERSHMVETEAPEVVVTLAEEAPVKQAPAPDPVAGDQAPSKAGRKGKEAQA